MRRGLLPVALILGLALAAPAGAGFRPDPAPAAPAGAGAADTTAAAPETLKVEASIHPAVVKLGERVSVRFAVPLPDTAARLIGPPAPTTFGEVDVVKSEPAPAGPDSAGWAMEVALFRTGDQTLTSIPFVLATPSGRRPVRLLPYSLSVESSLPDTGKAELRDIAPPAPVATRWRWGRITLALATLIALAAGVVVWVRRPKRAVTPVPVLEPSIPPEEAALAALRELERESLAARGQVKEHYARLSLVLRGYLERRFRFPAVESTTDEIRESLARSPVLRDEESRNLFALLEEADLVKFARHDPGLGAAGDALARGRRWIETRLAARRAAARPVSGGAGAEGPTSRKAAPPGAPPPAGTEASASDHATGASGGGTEAG
jgi:hypothetical protein